MSSQEAVQRLFFAFVTVALFLMVPIMRWGLATDYYLLSLTCACGMSALGLPALLMRGRLARHPSIVIGPLSVGTLAIAILLSYLGVAGAALAYLLAAVSLVALVWRAMPGAAWQAILKVVPALLLILFIIITAHAGTKYSSFVADALALYGRADGDVLSHAAVINAIRYFGVPSVGIDGISAIHYHIGIHYFSARLATWSDASAIEALFALKLLLHPLSGSLAVSAGLSIAQEEELRPSAVAGIWLATIFLCLMPFNVYWPFESESGGLQHVFLIALLPSAFLILRRIGRAGAAASPSWFIAAIALALLVLPLSVLKIPGGYLWTALIGFWAMNALGWRNPRTWGLWLVLLVGLGISIQLLTLRGDATVRPLGMLRDIHSIGDAYTFIFDYLAILLAIVWVVLLRRDAAPAGVLAGRTFFGPGLPSALPSAAIALVAAMLPSLVIDLPSGNVGHFIVLEAVLALPLLLLCGFAALQRGMFRRKAIVVLAVLVVGWGCYTTVRNVLWDRESAFAQQALIRTGDTSFYAKEGHRALRADANRFLDAGGSAQILDGTIVEGPAAPLADQLQAFRAEFGNQAAVYAPQPVEGQAGSALWDLTTDCAGKALFTMAEAGLPMINGYPPCEPKFIYNGYTPPARLARLDDVEVCRRANDLGFGEILIVESVTEPSRNRRLSCYATG